MNLNNWLKRLLVALVVTGGMVLTSCGGGGDPPPSMVCGDGGSPPPSTLPYTPSTPRYAYVVNFKSNQILQYSANPSTGVLSPAFYYSTQDNPSGIAVAGDYAYVTYFSTTPGISYRVSQFSINPLDGRLSPTTSPEAQVATGNNPNGIVISPDRKFAYISNGGFNSISKFSIDASTGALTEVTIPDTPRVATGIAPNGLAFSPNGKFLYVTNNDDNKGTTLSAFSVDSAGDLTPLVPATYNTGIGPTGIAFAGNGDYAYVSNFGNNTITIYSANSSTGALITLCSTLPRGRSPSGIAIAPYGNFVYQLNWAINPIFKGSTLFQFWLNPTTGRLTAASAETLTSQDEKGEPVDGEPNGIAFK